MEKSRRTEKIDAKTILETMLSTKDELFIVVNQEGYLEALSDAYAEFLGVDLQTVIGRHVSEVIENTRMDIVTKTGVAEIGAFQEINGETMVATRVPIYKDGKVIGAYGRVLFRNMKDLQVLYDKLNVIEMELNLYRNTFEKINTSKYNVDDIIGNSNKMVKLKDTVRQVAKTNSSVLILGESGTGKELFAHSIHSASMRKKAPFICVNCGTIPEQLIESELFGYEEGAFTGAKKGGKIGMFQAANGGTIFLDEIGDLPLGMQVKLLRVLQDKEIQKVGSNVSERINVRIVAATNKNLEKMVATGQFRDDLYYRLNIITLNIPALRDRKEDIPMLVKSLLAKISQRENMGAVEVSRNAMEYLTNYDWPGNVRELENVLERAINFVGSERRIEIKHLPFSVTGVEREEFPLTMKEIIEQAEQEAIKSALIQCRHKKTKAAQQLGISRTTLYEKMIKYGLCEMQKEKEEEK